MLVYFLCWFPMLMLAIANGALREFWMKKFMSDDAAHRLSTLTLLILFGAYIWIVIKQFQPASIQQAWYIGVLWVVLTLLFEFGFGLYRGNTLAHLLSEYNLLKGKLWVFIPLWVLTAPALFYRLSH